jgi:putative endonuclease
MYYVYVLKSTKDDEWYTGCTNNIKRRLEEHNTGKVPSTKERIPFVLIYCEMSPNAKDSYKREKYLKSGPGKKYLRNRLSNHFSVTG